MIYLIPIAVHHIYQELRAKHLAKQVYHDALASGAMIEEAKGMALEAYRQGLN